MLHLQVVVVGFDLGDVDLIATLTHDLGCLNYFRRLHRLAVTPVAVTLLLLGSSCLHDLADLVGGICRLHTSVLLVLPDIEL